jgi:hypothetical protein
MVQHKYSECSQLTVVLVNNVKCSDKLLFWDEKYKLFTRICGVLHGLFVNGDHHLVEMKSEISCFACQFFHT